MKKIINKDNETENTKWSPGAGLGLALTSILICTRYLEIVNTRSTNKGGVFLLLKLCKPLSTSIDILESEMEIYEIMCFVWPSHRV